jgi:outer membrane protein assembly factor BamB
MEEQYHAPEAPVGDAAAFPWYEAAVSGLRMGVGKASIARASWISVALTIGPLRGHSCLALMIAAATSCAAAPEPRGPCMSDTECRGDRICHEGRCRYEEDVRVELASARAALETAGNDSPLDAGMIATPVDAGAAIVDAAAPRVDERAEFMGGPRHDGRSANAGPSADPATRWVHRTGARVYASPVVAADGTIYVGSTDRTFVALSPDGSLRFRYSGADRFYATAAIDRGGNVIVGNHDGSVVSLTPNGQVRWRRVLGAPVDASATIDEDGTIYVAADGLHALDPSTGVDRFHVASAGALRTTPAIHPARLVVFGTADGRVVAARCDGGAVAWEHALGGSTDSSPAIADDGTIVIGDDLGHVTALDASGAVRWQVTTDGDVRATPAITTNGTVIVGSDDRRIYGISARGEVLFRVQTSGRVRASARIDREGRIYVGSQDDFLYVLGPDGTLLFRHGLGHDVDSTAAIAADGTLIVGVDDGGIYALR